MTTNDIPTVTWADVQENDIVTFERGTERTVGHELKTLKAMTIGYETLLDGHTPAYWKAKGFTVVSISRPVVTPKIPDDLGSLVLADEGLFLSDGDDFIPWGNYKGYFSLKELTDPIEMIPVPAKELREFRVIMSSPHSVDHDLANAAIILNRALNTVWERIEK